MHIKNGSLLCRLPQNIAGVTILAFGNGAPDVFSALASVQQSRPELLLGALFGAGVFVTTAVTGAICLAKPFKLMERPFLRDVTFYLAAGFWAFCIFYRYVFSAKIAMKLSSHNSDLFQNFGAKI